MLLLRDGEWAEVLYCATSLAGRPMWDPVGWPHLAKTRSTDQWLRIVTPSPAEADGLRLVTTTGGE